MTKRNITVLVVIVAVVAFGGGAAVLSRLGAPQAPERMSSRDDREHVGEDHRRADSPKHSHEEAERGESEHELHGSGDAGDRAAQEGDEGHDNDAGHADRGAESVVRLSAEERKRFGVKVAIAQAGMLTTHISLPGEIVLNADQVAHIVPRVEGIVRSVNKSLGDLVEEGEAMAVLESRELAEAKSEDIAAEERLALAQANFTRAERLQAKGISSEEDYLTVKQRLAEAEIEHRKTEARLYALGLTADQVRNVSAEPDETYSVYELKAPFVGTIVDRHISVGELVDSNSEVFTLADLTSVWVDISVYQKHLPHIRKGMRVTISAGAGMPHAQGTIAYLAPVVDEKTRTALARVVLPNPDGQLRPGLFVTAQIQVDEQRAAVLVPKEALQTVEGRSVLFVETDEGFELRPVAVGRSDDMNVEITAGLKPGERFVTANAFTLKSELAKAGFEAGHAH